MSGPVCKVIINDMTRALSQSLEKILIDPSINGGKIPEADRLAMIQDLANIDLCAFAGADSITVGVNPPSTMLEMVARLDSYGLISPDVWVILPAPTDGYPVASDPPPGPVTAR